MPETRHVWISVKQILEGILEARMWLFRTCPVLAVSPPFSSGLCPGPFSALVLSRHLFLLFIGTLVQSVVTLLSEMS